MNEFDPGAMFFGNALAEALELHRPQSSSAILHVNIAVTIELISVPLEAKSEMILVLLGWTITHLSF